MKKCPPDQAQPQVLGDRETRDRQLFNESAPVYWRKDLSSPSQRARKLRLTETLRLVYLPAAARVLEVGCGAGFAASYLRDRFGSYLGVDYSENLIKYARLYNGGPNVHFTTTNIKTFASDEPFDLIFLVGVLHHLEEVEPVVRRLVELLKPGGWLVANEPQPTNPLIRLARFARKKLDRDYSSDQSQLSARQLKATYVRAGLVDIRARPQGLFSTPFAETLMRPRWLVEPLSAVACLSDVLADRAFGRLLTWVTWNVVVAGCRPGGNAACHTFDRRSLETNS